MVLEVGKRVDDATISDLLKVESIGKRLLYFKVGTVVLKSMVDELIEMGF